jgi:hypothetical protein
MIDCPNIAAGEPCIVEGVSVDGANWLLEGARGGRYTSLEHNSPSDAVLWHACLQLLIASKLPVPLAAVY